MADTTNKPVVFLAFANDRDDTVGYLRNLPDEARRLRDVLQPAVQAGLCEVEVRSNSTAADIFKVFQDPQYRNRIAIFHYGGHANGFQLLLESAAGQAAAADAGGLAKFLAQQRGLQLVFLNGCSTQQQTQGLLDANVSAVISTSRSIDDRVATNFACHFYHALGGGAGLQKSFDEAEAVVETTQGSDARGLYFGDAAKITGSFDADRLPWLLSYRAGMEHLAAWNLPNAADDPLFGLPPLPEQDLPESPYRHLNWFSRKDADVYFGRGHQIRKLYDRLTAPRTAPIMLFYGQSGVGKSSILDAGLIPRLEQDCEVRYLRRGEGGLLDSLQLAFLPEASDAPIETAWRVKEQQLGKPLIVFLDQVEELYTRPIADLPHELHQLLEVVKATFVECNQRPRGKLVLGFRKEWLAELEAQLVAHELPRTKVFLEPLDRRGIIEVVQGPARSKRLRERYGLEVEDGLAEIIADDLLADRDSNIAPTLQILLTKMWTKATEANYEHPHFSQDLYQHLKRDGILLRDFLNQQIAAFRQRYPEAVDSGLLLDIVALHTTPLGTADQRTVEQLQEQYSHLGATLPGLIQQCQDLHLLTIAASSQKESVNTTRLAHDTLAPLVREQFDISDKPGQRARRILDNRSVDWSSDQTGTPLDAADLKVVEQGVNGTRALSATERRLLEASRDLQARLRRTRQFAKIAASVAAVIIVVVAGIAVWQRHVALQTEQRAQEGRIDRLIFSIFFAPPATSGERMTNFKDTVATSNSLREYAVLQLKSELDNSVPLGASPDEETSLASGQASLAVALAGIGAMEEDVVPLLKRADVPTLRSYLIHRFSEADADPKLLADQLKIEEEPSVRRALILGLGEFAESELGDQRDKLIHQLIQWYRADPDPGVHAASEWLVRQWGEQDQLNKVRDDLKESERQLKARKPDDKRRWYVNTQGQAMVVIKGPVEFEMGSPETEENRSQNEQLQAAKLTHSFAIADKEVTNDEFRRFLQDKAYRDALGMTEGDLAGLAHGAHATAPAVKISWYMAVAYCNWLTEQEMEEAAAQLCYDPIEDGNVKFAEGMTTAADYLKLRGYRLPTEAEWEYACRAKTKTRWSHGEAKELLVKYARYGSDSPLVTGHLKPNDFGLFDMHGNAMEWCQDVYDDELYTNCRVLRGGSFSFNDVWNFRSAFRYVVTPDSRDDYVGFRVARTYD